MILISAIQEFPPRYRYVHCTDLRTFALFKTSSSICASFFNVRFWLNIMSSTQYSNLKVFFFHWLVFIKQIYIDWFFRFAYVNWAYIQTHEWTIYKCIYVLYDHIFLSFINKLIKNSNFLDDKLNIFQTFLFKIFFFKL